MDETRYPISEAAKLTQVDAHVLRYWEEELGLEIARNEMGHRYYTEKDIQTFLEIKELKKTGMQLRSIREKLRGKEASGGLPRVIIMKPQSLRKGEPAVKAVKTVSSSGRTVLSGNAVPSETAASEELSQEEEFLKIMDRLVREIRRNERKEGRYRRLDEAIRRHQQSRRMVAVTQEKGRSRRKSKIKKTK